jgi:hypothetical protein
MTKQEYQQEFDKQKRMLESLHAGSAEEHNAITKAIHLNREGFHFSEEGQGLLAQIRFSFVEQVGEAIRTNKYEDFKKVVDYLLRSEQAKSK